MAKKSASTATHAALEDVRNIGIIAHIDAGKTTTTERVLYYTGANHNMGEVDHGTTTTDFDAEESQRGITIYSAAVTAQWQDKTINIIDTPGHVDFTAEVERSLRVLDGAVVVFSAVEGVEAQSETVWRQADRYGVPRICFINKMDRIGASFERTLEQIATRLSCQPVALMIPVGEGHDFEAIIDVRTLELLRFDSESKGKTISREPVPEPLQAEAEEWQSKLFETVAMLDDAVMEQYLEDGTIEPAAVNRLLRTATLAGQVQPVFCGSSLDFVGVQPVLDGVVDFLPSPLDRPPVEGTHPSPKHTTDEGVLTRKPSPDEPLSALVFKIVTDQHGDLSFVRVYSGVLRAGSRPINARVGKKELCSQLVKIQASRPTQVDEAIAGEIVGVIGLKESVTGDTLCDAGKPIALEPITFPQTVISMAVEPESSADRKKLEDCLTKLARQDPTFTARVSDDTGQTIISGMGELHLDVLKNRLLRDFRLDVRVHKPRVSYRETVRKAVQATAVFQRPSGDSQVFGEVTLTLAPRPVDYLEKRAAKAASVKAGKAGKGSRGSRSAADEVDEPVTIVNAIKPGTVDAALLRAVEESVEESAGSGGILGYPLLDVLVTIDAVRTREGESTEDAMRAAASMAFQDALNDATIVLLEPVMKLEVVSPDESVGAIQADLNQRHAVIVGQEPRGETTVLQAQAPLARMFGYSTDIRSLSQGRASYSMEPLRYEPAPESVMKEMLS